MQVLFKKAGPAFFAAFIITIPLYQTASIKFLLISIGFSLWMTSIKIWKDFVKLGWDLILYFVVLALGVAYSSDLTSGYKELETNFALLAIPFSLALLNKSADQDLQRIVTYFLVGLVAACIICFAHSTYQFAQQSDFDFFLSYNLTSIIRSHPTYLAYCLIFAITILLYRISESESVKSSYKLYLLVLLFFITLQFTRGETSFISLLFVFSFFLLKAILQSDWGGKKVFIVSIFFMLLTFFIVKPDGDRQEAYSDAWDRVSLWKSSWEGNPDLLLGVGTGDHKQVLNDYYRSQGLVDYADKNFNPHNQFLQILLSNGLLGLTAMIIMIGRPLVLAARSQDSLGVLIFFPFIIYGITEVFLGRYQGVVLFGLLHQLYISRYNLRKAVIDI